METIIVTGASRGLGAALAMELVSPDRYLICVARKPNEALAERARTLGAGLDYYLQDLANTDATDELASAICTEMARDSSRYVLINNAGVVGPVAFSSHLPVESTVSAFNVNVTAAMIFASRFLAATENLAAPRQILNISSGAGRRPIAGWGVYCTSKAALDMFSRCIKVEQAHSANPARVSSLAPGVIDTDMQTNIRGKSIAEFPDVQRFVDMKAEGQLVEPSVAARRIIAYLDSAEFGETEIDGLKYN